MDDYLIIPALKRGRAANLCPPNASLCKALRDAMAGSQVPWIMYVFTTLCLFFLLLFVTERSASHASIYPDIVLILLMVIGSVVQVACLARKHKATFVNFPRLGHVHSNAYLMAGVYVFGMGSLFSIVLRLQIYYHAYEAIVDCDPTKLRTNSMEMLVNHTTNSSAQNRTIDGYCKTEVAYDSVRALFTLIQIFFMQTFRTATFQSSGFVKFTLYHTIVTNGCTWLKYVLKETSLFHKSTHTLNGFDSVAENAWHTGEFMTPFVLEYSLIAAGILQTISMQMQKQNAADPNEENGQGIAGARAPMIEVEAIRKPPGSQPGLILGALCSIVLVAASLTFQSPMTLQSRRSHDFFLIYEGFLALLQIVLLLQTLHYLQKHLRFEYEVRVDDTLLFIGFIGILSFHCLTFVSVVMEREKFVADDNVREYIITIVHLLVLLIEQFMQTFLIILSRRYSPLTTTHAQQLSCGKIRQCCLFLLTTNLGFWALDTFVEMKDSAKTSYPTGPVFFGKDWITVTSLTYPFLVFFRFHSAAMLFEFCSRFNPGDGNELKRD